MIFFISLLFLPTSRFPRIRSIKNGTSNIEINCVIRYVNEISYCVGEREKTFDIFVSEREIFFRKIKFSPILGSSYAVHTTLHNESRIKIIVSKH